MRYFFHTLVLLLLTNCGDSKPYPKLADGPAEDYKPPITLEEARAELATMQKECDRKRTPSK